MNRQSRRPGIGLFLLAGQIMNVGVGRIPPVTLAVIAAQVAIFLKVGDLERWFSSSHGVCMSSYLVWRQKQWPRLLLATFYHANDIHLYFNMVSLLYKGMQLERRFKSVYFAYLLTVFSAATGVMYVALNILFAKVFEDGAYELECAVGFSGVVFALKVLTIHYSPPGMQYMMGFIPVPSKYIFWAELALIQVMVPNASFTGHLAGILVGLLYTKGPLKAAMDSFIPSGPSYTYNSGTSGFSSTYRGSASGSGQSSYTTHHTRQSDVHNTNPYSTYTGGLTEEEQMRRATEESLRNSNQNPESGSHLYPDLDDLRQRRSQRYQ